MKKQRVMVAMSGGVDSAVAAAMLVKQGYEVEGWHMKLWAEAPVKGTKIENKCCSTESMLAAKKICDLLKIPFRLVNYNFFFKKQVVDYFVAAYKEGLTPNPCIACNKFIKFGELYDYARAEGFDYVATGHYALLRIDASEGQARYQLLQAKDKKKDQTYFLYNLNQEKLAHILFPIGEYQKTEVRQMAREFGLPVAEKPESQEICFLPENDYRPFLQRQGVKGKPGEIANVAGEVIGEHRGLELYTIGQRRGFSITNYQLRITNEKKPWYVVGKDIKNNRLVVGTKEETGRKEIEIGGINWINNNYQLPIKNYELRVRIRHGGELIPITNYQLRITNLKIQLGKKAYGVSPGQAAVLYQGEEVVGGGTIVN